MTQHCHFLVTQQQIYPKTHNINLNNNHHQSTKFLIVNMSGESSTTSSTCTSCSSNKQSACGSSLDTRFLMMNSMGPCLKGCGPAAKEKTFINNECRD
jgi:hypothetical protein